MKYNKLSRRLFLQGSGGAMLSLPLLESLLPREAWGQNAEPVKRYIALTANHESGHARNWFPKLTPLSKSMPIPGSPQMATYDTLADLLAASGTGQLSRIFNSSINPFINQMMLYKGLDIPTHGFHDQTAFLGNLGRFNPKETPNHTESIDRFLSKHPKFDPAKRISVHLGPGYYPVSYERNLSGEVVAATNVAPWPNRAIDIYNVLFNKGSYPESGSAPVIHPRRDILTRVLGDYQRVRAGRQIGSTDKIILDNVMDKISDLQAGLKIEAIASCKHKGQDPLPENNQLKDFDQKIVFQNYIHLIQALFLCDISRSITLTLAIPEIYDHSGTPTSDFHQMVSHKPGDVYNNIPNWQHMGNVHSKWVTNFLSPLLAEMSSTLDPANNKSFLHNGLVHVNLEQMYFHTQVNMPTATFGSLNGALKTGYMINYCDYNRPFTFGGGAVRGGAYFSDDPVTMLNPMTDNHTYDYPGLPYQRFLVTVLQAMGLSPSDYENAESHNSHFLNRSDSLYGPQNNGITFVGGFGQATPLGVSSDPHFVGRLKRYNFNYYRFPLPMPA